MVKKVYPGKKTRRPIELQRIVCAFFNGVQQQIQQAERKVFFKIRSVAEWRVHKEYAFATH
jgi:hypothetical protein